MLHDALYKMAGVHYQLIYDETDIDVPELFDLDEIELYELYQILCRLEDQMLMNDADKETDDYRVVYETVRILGNNL